MDQVSKLYGHVEEVCSSRYEQLKTMVEVAAAADNGLYTINAALASIERGEITAETIRANPEEELARLHALLTLARETAISLRDRARFAQQDIARIIDLETANARFMARLMLTDPAFQAKPPMKEELQGTTSAAALSVPPGPVLVVDNGGLPN